LLHKYRLMSEERDHLFDDNDTAESVKRFEQMVRNNINSYFDVHEFESIIDYYLDINKFNDALRATEIAFQQHPNAGPIHFKRIQVLINKGEPVQALKLLGQIEQIEVSNPDFYILKGTALAQMGKVKDAIRLFDQSLQLSYENKEEILYDIALTFEHLNHYKAALPYLQKAYEINSSNLSVLYDLAYCYERMEEDQKCVEFYKLYLDADPFSENVWYNIGTVYSRMENYQMAIESYDFAIAINEKYSSAYFNKANALASSGEYEKAIEVFNEFLYLEPENLDALYYIGESFERLQQYDLSLIYYRKVLETEPEYSDAWFGIGVVHYHQEKYKESIAYIKKAIELDEHNGEYWYSLGNAYSKQGNPILAVKAFRQAIEIDPYDYESWLRLGDLILHTDHLNEAILLLNEAYHYNFDIASLNYRLAAYHFMNRNEELGCRFLEKGLSQDLELHIEIFETFPELKEREVVRELINRYKRLNPGL
jgi:tetratricopeptide (TPR) repeat protein